jgi:hypothetical protein
MIVLTVVLFAQLLIAVRRDEIETGFLLLLSPVHVGSVWYWRKQALPVSVDPGWRRDVRVESECVDSTGTVQS